MSERQETINDIIAEKRRRADEIERDYAEKMKRGEMVSDCYARELVADIRREADRLEAAHKRERGDCAKLREALKLCMDEMCNRCRDLAAARSNPLPCLQGCEPVRKARAALAAPPRNCDIYLTEEAVDVATVTVRDCEACSRIDMEAPCVFCMVRWLLAPATEKEGGAKC